MSGSTAATPSPAATTPTATNSLIMRDPPLSPPWAQVHSFAVSLPLRTETQSGDHRLGVLLAETTPGAEEEGLDRRAGDAEAIGDGAVVEAVDLAEHQHLAVSRVEQVEHLDHEAGGRPPVG